MTFAQQITQPEPAIKFGKISPDQFQNIFSDSTAEAVVLYDYGETWFDVTATNLWLNTTYHSRLFIRKKSAYERAIIRLLTRRGTAGQHEQVSEFDGYTYNLTGGTVAIDRLTKAGHFTEKVSDDLWVEKYTMPNVREGAIIEYRYTIRTPFTISHNPPAWRFQQNIPVKWSEYRIAIPDYFYYSVKQNGYLSIAGDQFKQGSVAAYRFLVKDAPAFREEVYITTKEDYISKVEFELASYQLPGQMLQNIAAGWEAMDKTLLDDATFGGQIKRAGFLREKAKSIYSEHADTLARVTAAYNYIRHAITWNEESAIWARNIKKVFDEKKGDAADINLLLIAFLREMGMEANPVILSTRSHGRIDDSYALLKKFNYVIAQVLVNGKDLLLDATDSYLTPGMLPFHCLNGKGRLVHPTNSRFISLSPTERDTEAQTATFQLNDEGEVTGTIINSHSGYSAWSARKKLAAEGRTKYLESVQKKRPGWQIESSSFTEDNPKKQLFKVNYKITVSDMGSKAGDRLYFRPMLTEARLENPFKEPERLYPVDFGAAIDETFTATYTLPGDYQVEEIPKPVSMTLPDDGGRFLYQVTSSAANQIHVVSRIVLRRPVYSAEEYGPLRELFSRIVAKHAEPIVLKRGSVAEKK
ncbi:hypothetical protein GCM10028809_19880 [Spirosoma gilvum]